VRGIGPVHPFMVWNLYLAAIPALLAIVLFRRPPRIGVTWLCGLVAWVLFLPNAPYVLTDVVHMVDDLHASPSRSYSFQVLAVYAMFFACGLASYVLSLKLFSRFLRRVVRPQVALATLIALHGLCIVAMYLGRFMRFNSWDMVFDPGAVLESVIGVPRPTTLFVLVTMFVVVGVGTFVTAVAGSKAISELRRLFLR
jgi:uncharacterized membrane protein